MVHSRKNVLGLGLAAAGFFIIALLIAGVAMGGDGGLADDRIADMRGIGSEGLLAASSVNSSINYQGRLTDSSGNPLSGTYNMTFRIWDAASSGSALWKDTHLVLVTDGLFSTNFAVDPMYLDGRALWLGVQVGDDDEMTPRQELRPVPYALSLRPGTEISGSVPGSAILRVYNTYKGVNYGDGIWADTTANDSYAVYATTSGYNSSALYGYSERLSASTEGVRNQAGTSPQRRGGHRGRLESQA